MRRREFITLVGGVAVAWALPAQAQQPAPTLRRLGYLFSFVLAEGNHLWERVNWVCGSSATWRVEASYSNRDGRMEVPRTPPKPCGRTGPAKGEHHHSQRPHRPLLAAMAATQEIPIVMVGIGDPVTSGFDCQPRSTRRERDGTEFDGSGIEWKAPGASREIDEQACPVWPS